METGPPNNVRRPSAPSTVHRLIWAVVSLFVLLMIIIGMAWGFLNPHEPGFRVSSLSVSNFTVTVSQLRGKYDMELNISNPNKKIGVLLDHFSVSVCYGEFELSRATVPPVSLGRNITEKVVKVELVVGDLPEVPVHTVSGDLGKDRSKGKVNFNVKMQVRTRFKAGLWPTKEQIFQVSCGDLHVGFFPPKNNGKLLGIDKDCHVSTLQLH